MDRADRGDLRDQIERLATRDGDLTEVRRDLDGVLRRVIGYDVAALSTMDPATQLWTSCFVSGLPAETGGARERVIFDIEFRGTDVNGYHEIARRPTPVGRLYDATNGHVESSERWEPLLSTFGVVDEMRAVLRARGGSWGSLTLYRTGASRPFDERDEAVIASASSAIAELFRLALIRAALAAPGALDEPPGLLHLDDRGLVVARTDAAERWLRAIDDRDRLPSVVSSLAAATRSGNGLAKATIPTRDGRWVVLHGSPLVHREGAGGEVAVIIEGARRAALAEIIANAYGLTERERDITTEVARGQTTRQIARELDISPFTVQDHLKSIFRKTGSQSRGEMIAAIFFDYYQPRRDAGDTPSPYGWYLDEHITAA